MNKTADIVVFACNWDGLSCIEAAAQARLRYPASVRVVRVSCLSRVHLGLMLKAFELGADGVMLLGCEPGRCHYGSHSQCVAEEYGKAQGVLRLMGMSPERLVLALMPCGDGPGFVAQVNSLVSQIGYVLAPAPPTEVIQKESKIPSYWQFRTEG